MPSRKVSFWTESADRDRRLDEVLAARLAEELGRPVSRGRVRKVIMAGAVSVNGRPLRTASAQVGPLARIEAWVDLARLDAGGTSSDKPFVMEARHVLYEDALLLVVDKPAGLPTHRTLDAARHNLVAAVERYLRERDGLAPSAPAPYLGLHQRLDRDTSGALLLVKDPAANAQVGRLFSERLVVKTYQALTARGDALPPPEWTVRNFLGPAPRRRGQGKRTRYTAIRSGGAPAHTELRMLEAYARGLHVEARPHTGRTHQIRVHLAEAGLPILGDDLYGDDLHRAEASSSRDPEPPLSPPRLMLHAVSLAFPSPATGEEQRVESPLPPDFQAVLAGLKADVRAR